MRNDELAHRPGILELAAAMAENGSNREAPVRAVMALLGDRWTTLILLVLGTGEARHASLRRVLAMLSAEQSISQRVLTLKLRTLEREGLVERIVVADVPPKVSYRLSGLGEELLLQTRGLISWIEAKSGEIRMARERFDSEQ